MSHDGLDRPSSDMERFIRQRYKSIAALIVLVLSIHKYFSSEVTGDSIYLSIVAFIVLLAELPYGPGHTIRHLVLVLRKIFYESDSVARTIIIFVSFVFTAAVVKYIYGLDLLNQYLDPWAKRLAASLLFISPALYISSILSKRVYVMSVIDSDESVRRYEVIYYMFCMLYFVFSSLFWMGWNFEESLPILSGRDKKILEISYYAPHFSFRTTKMLGALAVISMIWMGASGFCIMSRYFEWRWKDVHKRGVHIGESTIQNSSEGDAKRKTSKAMSQISEKENSC